MCTRGRGEAEAQRWRNKGLSEGKQALSPAAHLENVTIETGSPVGFPDTPCPELSPPGYSFVAQGLGCTFKEGWQAGCRWASGQKRGRQVPCPCPEPADGDSWDVGAGRGGGRRETTRQVGGLGMGVEPHLS